MFLRSLLLFYLLIHVSCVDGQFIINPYTTTIVDTNVNGEQLFGVVGDSNADGRGPTIPTVASNTLYLWNGTSFSEITTQSVSNDDNTKGSIWQQFATDYKASTGHETLLVNGASGGAEYYPNGDNNNWYTSGTLYAAWKTKMTNALSSAGLNTPKAIFVNLGINDVRSANSIADITTGVNSLVSRITSDYPNTPVIFIQVGRSEVADGTNSQKLYDMRKLLITTIEANASLYMCGSGAALIGTSGYIGDNLHYTQASNDFLGSMFNRWFVNSDVSNKWARAVVSSTFDNLSSGRKSLLATFITDQYNNGNYFKIENLFLFKNSNSNNIFNDLTFLSFAANAGATFTSNTSISTNGTTSVFTIGFIPSIYTGRSSTNDVIVGVKLKTKTTTGSSGFFGRIDASSNALVCYQGGAPNTNYRVNDQTTSNLGTDAGFVANNLYSVARNGGTKYIIKNSTVDASASVASTGALNQAITIGGVNNNGSVSLFFNASYEYAFAAKYSDLDLSSFYTGIENVVTNW
jgi:hypothetical protein